MHNLHLQSISIVAEVKFQAKSENYEHLERFSERVSFDMHDINLRFEY